MSLKPQIGLDLGEFYVDITTDDDLSSELDFAGWRAGAEAIIIYGPGALNGTATVQESFSATEDEDEHGTTWRDLQSGGSDVTVPADGSVRITVSGFKRLRISLSSPQTVDRRFIVRAIERSS